MEAKELPEGVCDVAELHGGGPQYVLIPGQPLLPARPDTGWEGDSAQPFVLEAETDLRALKRRHQKGGLSSKGGKPAPQYCWMDNVDLQNSFKGMKNALTSSLPPLLHQKKTSLPTTLFAVGKTMRNCGALVFAGEDITWFFFKRPPAKWTSA